MLLANAGVGCGAEREGSQETPALSSGSPYMSLHALSPRLPEPAEPLGLVRGQVLGQALADVELDLAGDHVLVSQQLQLLYAAPLHHLDNDFLWELAKPESKYAFGFPHSAGHWLFPGTGTSRGPLKPQSQVTGHEGTRTPPAPTQLRTGDQKLVVMTASDLPSPQ